MGHHGCVSIWAIVVAAGTGERFGGPKQLMPLGDRRVLDYSVDAAVASCDGVVLVLASGVSNDRADVRGVEGGPTRSDSVRAGLAAVPSDADIVVVHDAARPLADHTVFERVVAAVSDGADGAVPGLSISDTVKEVRGDVVVATVPRDALVTVQTPQAFRASVLRAAHASCANGTDDAAVVEAAGGRVVVVPGSVDNFKITTPTDLERAAELLAARERRS